jgi:hypothetical protein
VRISFRPLASIPAAEHARLAGGSFFASPGFLSLWRAKGGRPGAWVLEEGGRIVAMLAGVEYGAGPFARFASLPDGCYGGLLLDPDAGAEREALGRALFAALERRRYVKACVFDRHGTIACAPGFATCACETRLVDISGPDWAPPDPKLRAQIRRARREGVVVEPFDWDRHHARFLALVVLTARRQGQRPRYPAAFYRSLAGLAARDSRIVWRWCEHEGRPVASQIYFVERGTLQAWQSYYDKAFSFLKPNQYMRYVLCREMAGLGIGRLNLGSTPERAGGLAYYKSRWGGRSVRYASYVRREPLGRLAEALARTRPGVRLIAR